LVVNDNAWFKAYYMISLIPNRQDHTYTVWNDLEGTEEI